MAEIKIIRPQDGYQMKALASSADIVIGGGAAGAGKTFCLLLEYLRHCKVKCFGGVIFRRTSNQIRNEGGLWDTSMKLYPYVGAIPKESSLEWDFGGMSRLKFNHLEYEKDILSWQGSQIPMIGFDELTHFTEKMFFYMLSRNRSVCGIKPYIRATCNPDPDSWVAKLIEWWIDAETGFPIPERDGVIRYFVKYGDSYIWGDTKKEVITKSWTFLEKLVTESGVNPDDFVKSITFVSGSIYSNKELLNADPAYLGNLLSQDEQTRRQLLEGNWKYTLSSNDIYDYQSFRGLFYNKIDARTPEKYITADIALRGSNKFVVAYWEGKSLEDIKIMDKSDGKEVVDAISEMAKKYSVQNHRILFDADGVGGFIDGFVVGSLGFNGGIAPLKTKDMAGVIIKEEYHNLKTQCYYRSGLSVSRGEYRISEKVASMMYDSKSTIQQRFIYERKAIKRDKVDADGKLRIIPKEKMKILLNGDSPDLLDAFMMREFFELKPKFIAIAV